MDVLVSLKSLDSSIGELGDHSRLRGVLLVSNAVECINLSPHVHGLCSFGEKACNVQIYS